MVEFNIHIQDAKEKLLVFRSRYSPQEYPYKIAVNVVYLLLIAEQLIDRTDFSFGKDRFSLKPEYPNFDSAMEETLKYRPEYIAYASSNSEDTLRNKNTLMHIDLSKIRIELELAEKHDNRCLENMEYSYVFYSTLQVTLIYWLTLGLVGESRSKAFYEIFDAYVPNPFVDSSLTIPSFEQMLSIYVPKYYKKLPDYYMETK